MHTSYGTVSLLPLAGEPAGGSLRSSAVFLSPPVPDFLVTVAPGVATFADAWAGVLGVDLLTPEPKGKGPGWVPRLYT